MERSTRVEETAVAQPAGGLTVPLLDTPWLTVSEAALRARCGPKLIYREVRAVRLRAVRVGGRRELRFLANWIDEWLLQYRTIQ